MEDFRSRLSTISDRAAELEAKQDRSERETKQLRWELTVARADTARAREEAKRPWTRSQSANVGNGESYGSGNVPRVTAGQLLENMRLPAPEDNPLLFNTSANVTTHTNRNRDHDHDVFPHAVAPGSEVQQLRAELEQLREGLLQMHRAETEAEARQEQVKLLERKNELLTRRAIKAEIAAKDVKTLKARNSELFNRLTDAKKANKVPSIIVI